MTTERYRIVKKLGEGGWGRTYLVRDRKLGKLWAMKEWKEQESAEADADRERRREEEFRILRELDSPCFPRLVECFQEGGKRYLVMDWIRGTTLEERLISGGAFPWREAASHAVLLCGALEKLHGGKPPILHLDLKPSNIILTQDGPRLIDFGSAVFADAAGSGTETERPFAGTPGFAAPELYQGRRADERSDVYGLGAVLRAMLTGRRPKEGQEKPEGVPECLWEITERALQRDREKRFRNAGEMRLALEELLDEGADEETTGERSGKERGGRILTGAAILGAALLLLLSLSYVRNPESGNAFTLPVQAARKEEICTGKRLDSVFHSPVWELAGQEGERGRLFGIRYLFGQAVREAAGYDADTR